MSAKRTQILFLDQNYLNNLTKTRLGRTISATFDALLPILTTKFEAGLLICPFSSYRQKESELTDRDFEAEIYHTVNMISGGVQLLSFGHVIQAQMRRALESYVIGKELPLDPLEAFDRDPHPKIVDPPQLSPSSTRFASWTQSVRDYHLSRGDDPPVGGFAAQKTHEAKVLVEELYVTPTAAHLAGTGYPFQVFMIEFASTLMKDYDELTQQEPTLESGVDLALFLKSAAARAIPFIDIHSSLRAAMLTNALDRKISGTDLDDVQSISVALPYVDILTCDKYMKNLLVSTKLDQKYGTLVFGGKTEDIEGVYRISEGALVQASLDSP